VSGFLSWTHIPDEAFDLFDGCIRGTHAENTLDLLQLFVHSLMTVARNEDDAVKVLQEGWVPVRGELSSRAGAGVPQRRGIFFLSIREMSFILGEV